jgi:hypothetical protein
MWPRSRSRSERTRRGTCSRAESEVSALQPPDRGGNRPLNRALHTIALVQVRVDSRARAFLDRKQAEGKTWLESVRCLKRHLADVVYRRMVEDLAGALTT